MSSIKLFPQEVDVFCNLLECNSRQILIYFFIYNNELFTHGHSQTIQSGLFVCYDNLKMSQETTFYCQQST